MRKVLEKYKKQRLDSKHQASSSSPDSLYGSLAVDPGPELPKLCQEHLDRLTVTAHEICQNSAETVDQSDDQSGE